MGQKDQLIKSQLLYQLRRINEVEAFGWAGCRGLALQVRRDFFWGVIMALKCRAIITASRWVKASG